MSTIDQHTVLASLQKALTPAADLIDGRTGDDWLYFLGRFARLINFYDTNNDNPGSWEPMLLKDPVFLVTSISQTDIAGMYRLYLDTCTRLHSLIANRQTVPTNLPDTAEALDRLFDHLTAVFMHIKRWVYHMQCSGDTYELKTYMANEVKNTFSRYFWALLSLRQSLYLSGPVPGIKAVDTSNFFWFPQYEEIIWKQNRDKSPYWEVLGLPGPVKELKADTEVALQNTIRQIFTSVSNTGDKVFEFLKIILLHAKTSLTDLQQRKSHYPDTLLLRTFIHLLQPHQDQLNGIAHRHLQFYYRTILKQHPYPAQPDHVFLYAVPAKKDATFCLPAGTLFNAGFDAQKNPVLFSTTDEAVLNPAGIVTAYTMTIGTVYGTGSSGFLKNIAAPGMVQKDQKGNPVAWETFGVTDDPTTKVTQGFAIASPLLLLREGTRTILLTITFSGIIPRQLLQEATYYLSTGKSWQVANAFITPFPTGGIMPQEITIAISLPVTYPPVTAFTANPDGLSSNWPMLKMMFEGLTGKPPVILGISLEVWVGRMKSVPLYNDHGSLSNLTPFPLFGPAPAVNSNFIIGSDEIFSKPVTELDITLDWGPLPVLPAVVPDGTSVQDGFSCYYQQYNQYLLPNTSTATQPATASKGKWLNFFKRLSTTPPSGQPNLTTPFNSLCFGVTFQLLQNQFWTAMSLTGPEKPTELGATATDELLFAVDVIETDPNGKNVLLLPSSSYTFKNNFPLPAYDVSLQLSPLKFSPASPSGFARMTLTGPVYGFGAGLYPAVVTNAAYQNASCLLKQLTDRSSSSSSSQQATLPPALVNPPFTPLVAGLEISYTAKADCLSGSYPFECFHYSPFRNYAVPFNGASEAGYQYTINKTPTAQAPGNPVLTLYPPCLYRGYLFLEIENLLPARATNLYFELMGDQASGTISGTIDYFYISSTGWKTLPVLSDSTNGLCCSGIVTVNIPADIVSQSQVMPGNHYWISIATTRDPASISRTVLLTTNGFAALRTAASLPADNTIPELAACSITRPQLAVPQIATVVQPFPSFGGKAAGQEGEMLNLRVSNRLKTKDRAVSSGDYAGLIRQQFPDIFFAKTVFDPFMKTTGLYAIRSFKTATEAGAFMPLLNTCQQADLLKYVQDRASALASVQVANFTLQYVQVETTVRLNSGYGSGKVKEQINQLLNLFLSPWISAATPQYIIDQPITEAQVARCLRGVAGVASLEVLLFRSYCAVLSPENIAALPTAQSVAPATPTSLLISCMDHNITCIEQP